MLFRSVKRYIKYTQEEDDKTNRPYTSRYIGSLVADFHRNMLKGGVYLYPETAKSPKGKLRLLYECNPLAFIAEQAGGSASNGKRRILDIDPKSVALVGEVGSLGKLPAQEPPPPPPAAEPVKSKAVSVKKKTQTSAKKPEAQTKTK